MKEKKNPKTQSIGKESFPKEVNINISEEELTELARKAKAGDLKARDRVIEECHPVITIIAKGYLNKYQNQGIECKDLVQLGRIGVLKSIPRYDESRSPSFLPCAIWGIKGEILSELGQSNETIRISKRQKDFIKLVIQTHNKLKMELGREPGVDEIAPALRVKPEKVLKALESPYYKIEIDKPISDDETTGDGIEDTTIPPPDDNILKEERLKEVQDVIGYLSQREQDILCSSYGIKRVRETNVQISERLNISAERVRQIRDRANNKLRQSKQGRALYLGLRQEDDSHQSETNEDIFASGLPPEEIKERVLQEVKDLVKIIIEFEENIKKREKEGKYYVIGAHYFESGLWNILIICYIILMHNHLENTHASLLYNSDNYKTAVNRLRKLKYIFDTENDDFNKISDILKKFQEKYNINIYILQLYFVTYLFIYLFIDIGTLFSRETSLLKKDLRKAQKHLSAIRAEFSDPRSIIGQDLTRKMSGEVEYFQNMIHNSQTLYSPPAHKSTKSINILLFYYGNFIKQETNKYHWKEVGKLFEHLFHKFDPRDQLVYDIHGLQREYSRTKETKIREFVIDTLAKLSQLKPPRDKILQPALHIMWYLIDHDEKIYKDLTKKIRSSFPEGSNEIPNK